MLKLTAWLAAAIPLVAVPRSQSPSPKPANELAGLAWLAGEWRGKVGDTDVVEWHSDPDGGAIVMASKELTGGKVSLFDFGIVTAKDGKIAFTPYPNGKSSVAFSLAGFDPQVERATFE